MVKMVLQNDKSQKKNIIWSFIYSLNIYYYQKLLNLPFKAKYILKTNFYLLLFLFNLREI